VLPDDPIVPCIEGDGTGPDIRRASVRVFGASVQKAYRSKRNPPAMMMASTLLKRMNPRFDSEALRPGLVVVPPHRDRSVGRGVNLADKFRRKTQLRF
jgi:hypothetical protein